MQSRLLLRLVTQILLAISLLLFGIMVFATDVVINEPLTWLNLGSLLLMASCVFIYFTCKQYRHLHRVLEGQQ